MERRTFFRRSTKNKTILFRCLIILAISLILIYVFLAISIEGEFQTTIDAISRTKPLEAWGYNKERNINRLVAIQNSILNDIRTGVISFLNPFSIVDYGSDQGYFSISLAKIFSNAHIMSIELGGVGGEIWKTNGDVLALEDHFIKQHKTEKQVQICQALVKPEHFIMLNEASIQSHYQLVLSVFHWFDLKDKKTFQRILIELLHNAKIATFIELPLLGDDSQLIRKQVGYNNFKKWYEGSNGDIEKVIHEAARVHNISVKVIFVTKTPWIHWHRTLYRVEIINEKKSLPFGCEKRREIYGCQKRSHHNKCTITNF